MKKLFIIGLCVAGASAAAYAADDFGSRFSGQAPAGLGEAVALPVMASQDDMAAGLQDIAPAAGDTVTDTAPTDVITDTGNTRLPNADEAAPEDDLSP